MRSPTSVAAAALAVLAAASLAACSPCGTLDADAQAAFDLIAGTHEMEAGGLMGGEDADAHFTIGELYDITVDAGAGTLDFVGDNGALTRCWDGSNDSIVGDPATGEAEILIVQTDRSGGAVNYQEPDGGMIGASVTFPGGVPVYSFIPPGT